LKTNLRTLALSVVLAVAAIAAFPSSSVTDFQAREFTPSTIDFQAPGGMFMKGEELIYEVSYSMFDLGTVRITVEDAYQRDGKYFYKAKAFIDSYGGVPFVSLHYVFFSDMSSENASRFFTAHETKNPEEMPFVRYRVDYQKKVVTYEKGIAPQNKILKTGTVPISGPVVDGLSIFFYARNYVHQKKEVNVPSFVDEKEVNTFLNFMNTKTAKEIDAVKYPIQTVEFDGHADFVGFFGMTGAFSGFFSDDEAAIPIVAKMKVILGSVHIELIKWNRPGWTPPRAPKS